VFFLSDYRLRNIGPYDSALLLDWHNSEHVRAASFHDCSMTSQSHQQWLDSIANDPRSTRLVLESHGHPLGLLTFTNMERRDSTVHWGFYLGDPTLPKGTGSVLTYCGLEYAFGELRTRKIIAEVLASNLRSIKLHEKLGFICEGHFREQVFKNGEYHDVLRFALFACDWRGRFRSALGQTLFFDYASKCVSGPDITDAKR